MICRYIKADAKRMLLKAKYSFEEIAEITEPTIQKVQALAEELKAGKA